MKNFRTIIEEISEIIETVIWPVKVVPEFQGALMDSPLSEPLVVVGMREIVMNTNSLNCYTGIYNGPHTYTVPTELKVSANIYIPRTLHGLMSYDLLLSMTEKLLASEYSIYKITTENMRFDRNFLCVILPVTIHLREQTFGEY